MRVWPGDPYPLGAAYDGAGTNFSLFSEAAEGVELCLFDDADEETRTSLTETDGFVWHGYVPWVGPGQRYGYRVHGPWPGCREHPVFRRRRFPSGDNVTWFTPEGRAMTEENWGTGYAKAITILLKGDAIIEPDRRGEPVRDDSFLLLINASAQDLTFALPEALRGMWTCVLDTTTSFALEDEETAAMAGDKPLVEARSIQVLRRV